MGSLILSKMPKRNSRKSIQHLHGTYILEQVPRYEYAKEDGVAPVTGARLFAKRHKLKCPAVFYSVRTETTTDYFYLGTDGMYTLDFAERNWQSFSELVKIVAKMKESGQYDYEPQINQSQYYLPLKEPYYA